MYFQVKRKGTQFKVFAFDGQRCVGRGVFMICVYDTNTAIITDLFVRPECRGRGYGRELTKHCLEKALEFSLIKRVVIVDGSEFKQTGRIARSLGFRFDGGLNYSYFKGERK